MSLSIGGVYGATTRLSDVSAGVSGDLAGLSLSTGGVYVYGATVRLSVSATVSRALAGLSVSARVYRATAELYAAAEDVSATVSRDLAGLSVSTGVDWDAAGLSYSDISARADPDATTASDV